MNNEMPHYMKEIYYHALECRLTYSTLKLNYTPLRDFKIVINILKERRDKKQIELLNKYWIAK